MAAITSNGTGGGVWSSTATWAGGVVPGSGDTTSIVDPVTIAADVTVGSSPDTGGTAAINFSAGGSLAITGGTLTVLGGIIHHPVSSVVMSAGTSIVFSPPSGQQYTWDFSANNASGKTVVCNGTEASPCSISTDLTAGGLASYSVSGNTQGIQGFITVTWTNFTNFGTTSAWGVFSYADNSDTPQNTAITISNCIFTSSCFEFSAGTNGAWNGVLTFNNNTFVTSVGPSDNQGNANSSALFSFPGVASDSTPTGTISGNWFDGSIILNAPSAGIEVTHNILYVNSTTDTSSWTSSANWNNNLHIFLSGAAPGSYTYGDINSCYFLNGEPTDPLFLLAVAGDVTNCVFENNNPSNNQTGVVAASGNDTQTIEGNIVLPTGGITSVTPGCLCSCRDVDGLTSFYHNTHLAGTGAMVRTGDGTATTGQVPVVKANLIWNATEQELGSGYIWIDISGGPALDPVTPTGADYNATWNIDIVNPADYSAPLAEAGRGYSGPSSVTPGVHDFGNVNPGFVDASRNYLAWGATQGQSTTAGTTALIASNPTVLIPALMTWVRAGFVPTNAALSGFTYPGDPSTADANGNAWPGSVPNAGAMALASSPTPTPTSTGAALLAGM